MSNDVKKILDMVLALPLAQRIEIAEKVSASIPEEALELSPAWRAEIVRRIELDRADPKRGIPVEVAMERWRKELDEDRRQRGQARPG